MGGEKAIELIKLNFENYYWAEDGGARLDVRDTRAPFIEGAPRTTNNENPVMFLSEVLFGFYKYGGGIPSSWFIRVKDFIEATRVQGTYTFHRRPGQVIGEHARNTHDNIVGTVFASQLISDYATPKAICAWGQTHAWSFNNMSPETFDIRTYLQGKDQAVVEMAAGLPVGPVNLIWLWGSSFFGDMRFLMIRKESALLSFNQHKRLSAGAAWALLSLSFKMRGGFDKYTAVVTNYFKDPNHPIRQLINLEGSRRV